MWGKFKNVSLESNGKEIIVFVDTLVSFWRTYSLITLTSTLRPKIKHILCSSPYYWRYFFHLWGQQRGSQLKKKTWSWLTLILWSIYKLFLLERFVNLIYQGIYYNCVKAANFRLGCNWWCCSLSEGRLTTTGPSDLLGCSQRCNPSFFFSSWFHCSIRGSDVAGSRKI